MAASLAEALSAGQSPPIDPRSSAWGGLATLGNPGGSPSLSGLLALSPEDQAVADQSAMDWREREARDNMAAAAQPSGFSELSADIASVPHRLARSLVDAYRTARGTNPDPRLVPTDRDPNVLTADDRAAMMPETYVNPAVGGLLGGVASLLRRTIDAAAADAQHPLGEPGYVPQAIGPATEVAMMLAGGAPLAAEKGAAGIFGGRLMKTWNPEAAKLADSLEAKGLSPEQVWQNTRLYRGADGQWRQLIDDSASKLKLSPESAAGINQGKIVIPNRMPMTAEEYKQAIVTGDLKSRTLTLPDVIDHPQLFDAYPELRKVRIVPTNPEARELGRVSGDTIYMAPASPQDFHSTLLHETQHIVQNREGFARGGSPEEFGPAGFDKLVANFAQMRNVEQPKIVQELGVSPGQFSQLKTAAMKKLTGDASPEMVSLLEQHRAAAPEAMRRLENVVQSEHLIRRSYEDWFDQYKRLMGEAEARHVEEIWGKGLSGFPGSSELVPREQQIFRDRGKIAPRAVE